jgi:hypothetical protein
MALAFKVHVQARPAVVDSTPEDVVTAEQRYLDVLRRRVAWQSEAAARLRGGHVGTPPDVLELATLRRLVAAAQDAPRAEEWRAFLGELSELAEDGRLPETLERLVRVVFAELLEH